MLEVLEHPEFSAGTGSDAIDGKPVDWDVVMDGYAAAVDWPASAFWRELADIEPGRDHLALDPIERRRVVEERERDDLRDHATPGVARPAMQAQAVMAKRC